MDRTHMEQTHHLPHHMGLAVSFLVMAIVALVGGIHISLFAQTVTTQVSLSIVHSYSGDTQLIPSASLQNYGGVRYSSSVLIPLQVNASAPVDWFVQGDTTTVGGGVTGVIPPFSSGAITLLTGDGTKSISGYLLRWGQERINTSVHDIILDTQGPSVPSLISPVMGSTHSLGDPLSLSWASSLDSGVGLSGYTLIFARDAGLTLPFASLTVSGNTISVPASLWSSGTVYRSVIAYDMLGNSTMSSISYWNHGGGGSTGGGSSGGGHSAAHGGGGGYVLVKDDCEIDLSPSYYDRICAAVSTNPTGNGAGDFTGNIDESYMLLLGPSSRIDIAELLVPDDSGLSDVPSRITFPSSEQALRTVPPIALFEIPTPLYTQEQKEALGDIEAMLSSMKIRSWDAVTTPTAWIQWVNRKNAVNSIPVFPDSSAQLYVYWYYSWHPSFWNQRLTQPTKKQAKKETKKQAIKKEAKKQAKKEVKKQAHNEVKNQTKHYTGSYNQQDKTVSV